MDESCPFCNVGLWVEVVCVPCKGTGEHHPGYGIDPDWCGHCGGPGRWAMCSDDCNQTEGKCIACAQPYERCSCVDYYCEAAE